MSFADQLVLWLHIGFAIFTVGPVTLAISSTPRYIRKRDVAILRYLARITIIFTTGLLVVLVLGIVLGQLQHELSKPWLTSAMTLFVVALVLLVLIIRDQRKAIRALDEAARSAAAQAAVAAPADATEVGAETAGVQLAAGDAGLPGTGTATPAAGTAVQPAAAQPGADDAVQRPADLAGSIHLASVERGRIVAMGGVVNLIWLAVLALMVWQP
ncbi:MAG TPA: hypothetical protein VEL03_18220 [Streptosporangiaceae bacterium]|nr:hypothetical protein [Streptosporangiaceae bacterium]